MSATPTTGDQSYDEVRAAWKANHIRPLWENPVAHKAREGGPRPHLWAWSVVRPAIDDAMKVTTPAAVERNLEVGQPGTEHCARVVVPQLGHPHQAFQAVKRNRTEVSHAHGDAG